MKRDYLSVGAILLGVSIALAAGATTSIPGDEDATPSQDTLAVRPLKAMMVGLGQDMSRIGDGIWHEDFEMIRQGAQGIADHARVLPEEMVAIKEALGQRFEAFVQLDRFVHHTADELAGATAPRDMGRILDLYGQLQQGCVSCHAGFRNDVRRALY